MRFRKSFKYRLLFSYIAVILISFGFTAFFLDKQLENHSLQDLKSSIVTQARLIESQIPPESLKKKNTANLGVLVKNLSLKNKSRITIIDDEGKVLADSELSQGEVLDIDNHAARPEVRAALRGLTGDSIRYSATLKTDMLYVALPIMGKNGVAGIIRLALPVANVQKIMFTIRKTIILNIFFALGLASILAYVLMTSISRPLNKIINVSRRFAGGDFSQRIYYDSHDEIGELSSTLNKMAQDIESKVKEVEIQNQQLKTIFQNMVEGIIVTDKTGCIVSVNQAIEGIFNIESRKTKDRPFLEVIRNTDMAEIIRIVLEERKFVSSELSLAYPVQKVFQVNASPVYEKDQISGCLLVIHDVSEIRRLENIRRDFVANVSHELKTPLTSIKGFVETLLGGALDDKENNLSFLKIIQNHAERLDILVDDLLSLSRLESKEIALALEDFNLRHELDEIISGFRSQLKKKGVTIKNEFLPDTSLRADKGRIRQVFTNLIDNAVKFNKERGLVRIYAQEFNGKIKIIVEDSGIGIPTKDIPRIFERFYRVDKARSRELGGTGLGLSIVKHIVELHAGSVGVESTEGLGSKFFFILPK
ncbi:MAG: ATP-binding protein [Candidatus Omnitrophica bacterium]|nr:ATP-binding protein [Candidatus Omnitrophota bacterium]